MLMAFHMPMQVSGKCGVQRRKVQRWRGSTAYNPRFMSVVIVAWFLAKEETSRVIMLQCQAEMLSM